MLDGELFQRWADVAAAECGVKLQTALAKADADAALAEQGLDRLGSEDGGRPAPQVQRVKTDMEALMSKGFADFPGAAIAELLSGCNLKFWFLPTMHPEAKIKLREMRFKVCIVRPLLQSFSLFHSCVCPQLSTDMNVLTFSYDSKGFGGVREWTHKLSELRSVRTGLPVGFSPYASASHCLLFEWRWSQWPAITAGLGYSGVPLANRRRCVWKMLPTRTNHSLLAFLRMLCAGFHGFHYDVAGL